jgi:hypothetical protein
MDGIEHFVRPFTSPNAHGAIIIPSTPSGSRQRATLTWGAKATMPTVDNGISFSVVCCDEQLTEQDGRENYPVKRLYHNNDPTSDQWIDWLPPKIVPLKKKEQKTCGDNWDQLNDVGLEINERLADYAARLH